MLSRRECGLPDPLTCLEHVLCNRYLVEKLCDETPRSSFYKAYHLGLDRQVLLEVLPRRDLEPARCLDAVRQQASLIEFSRGRCLEVTSLRDQWPIFAYPYQAGQSLSSHVRISGKMQLERILPLARQITDVVAMAHGEGCCHGALSLDRIWLHQRTSGVEKLSVLGFGSHQLPASRAARPASGVFAVAQSEQARRQCAAEPGVRADISAVGRCLYRLATGSSWAAGQGDELGQCVQLAGLKWSVPRAVERGFSRILRRCFDLHSDTHYESVREFGFDLYRLECTARSLSQAPDPPLPPVTVVHAPARRRPPARRGEPKVIVRQEQSA